MSVRGIDWPDETVFDTVRQPVRFGADDYLQTDGHAAVLPDFILFYILQINSSFDHHR